VQPDEHERFSSRLASIPGVELIPSFGAWILLRSEDPPEMARTINRRLPGTVLTIPKHMPGAVRIPVRDAKLNEEVYQAVAEVYAEQAAANSHLEP
jgi:histidinol-phosphate/aromatic aminotransferase/cobyric acid decarboxylase-like protein